MHTECLLARWWWSLTSWTQSQTHTTVLKMCTKFGFDLLYRKMYAVADGDWYTFAVLWWCGKRRVDADTSLHFILLVVYICIMQVCVCVCVFFVIFMHTSRICRAGILLGCRQMLFHEARGKMKWKLGNTVGNYICDVYILTMARQMIHIA